MSIFACLNRAESNVQQALANEWAAVPSTAKSELLVILQATNIIKAYSNVDGDTLVSLISAATGQPFVDSFLAIVDKVATSIGVTIPAGATPVQTLQLIANYLTPKSGDNWGDTVLSIASYTLTNLVPGGGIVRQIAIPLVQWVYDNVFKPATAVPVVPAIVSEAANILSALPASTAPQTSSDTTSAQ